MVIDWGLDALDLAILPAATVIGSACYGTRCFPSALQSANLLASAQRFAMAL